MKKMYVFNGVHGSGKTTIAQRLANLYPEAYAFYPEIGRGLRNEVTYNALNSSEDFDREVLRRELERDEQLLAEPRIPLVETWHIGNIGYLAARSPHLMAGYESILSKRLNIFEPTAIFIDISWETFRRRFSENIKVSEVDDLVRFYRIIATKTLWIYQNFGINQFAIRNEGELSEALFAVQGMLDVPIQNQVSV